MTSLDELVERFAVDDPVFDEPERWSLRCLEPPDHTRIRRPIARVCTPSVVAVS